MFFALARVQGDTENWRRAVKAPQSTLSASDRLNLLSPQTLGPMSPEMG